MHKAINVLREVKIPLACVVLWITIWRIWQLLISCSTQGLIVVPTKYQQAAPSIIHYSLSLSQEFHWSSKGDFDNLFTFWTNFWQCNVVLNKSDRGRFLRLPYSKDYMAFVQQVNNKHEAVVPCGLSKHLFFPDFGVRFCRFWAMIMMN